MGYCVLDEKSEYLPMICSRRDTRLGAMVGCTCLDVVLRMSMVGELAKCSSRREKSRGIYRSTGSDMLSQKLGV
jgi:hypothetical protein